MNNAKCGEVNLKPMQGADNAASLSPLALAALANEASSSLPTLAALANEASSSLPTLAALGEAHNLFCCNSVKPYRPRTTEYEALFMYFLYHQAGSGRKKNLILPGTFFIQVLQHINHRPDDERAVSYFEISSSGGVNKLEIDDAEFTRTYTRANSFKNYTCSRHNLFFELNAYQKKDDQRSNHHITTTSGRRYVRDTRLDGKDPEESKGPHWAFPASQETKKKT